MSCTETRCANCAWTGWVSDDRRSFACPNCGWNVVLNLTPPTYIELPESGTPVGPKTPFHLVDLDFVAAMCNVYRAGLTTPGREPNGWKLLAWDDEHREEYVSKILRHLHAFTQTGSREDLAAIACNANILWHHAAEDK